MFIRKSIFLTLATLCVVVGLVGCTTDSGINPADSSPPSVVIKANQDGQYKPVSSVNYQGSPINVMCIVEDPDGVRGIKLQYVNTTSNSCTVGSTVYTGSFSVAVPPAMEQTLSGSPQVLTTLPLLTSIAGPFGCTVSGSSGIPIGHTIKLRCQGTNWSANPGVATALTELSVSIF